MNIDNLKQVNKLVEIKDRCLAALKELNAFAANASENPDSGGLYGYDVGYHAVLTPYSDGSGTSVDMSGCYVGIKLAIATRTILEEQIARIDEDLVKLGVDVNESFS